MVVFNYSSRELTTKVVYYGPGLCGKTTNLQFIYDSMPPGVKGKMLSLATKSDRTLFFDFLPIDLGEIGGMKTKVQLYTVPGQVFYNETRRLVLKGADGVVFVADSQEDMMDANKDSFRNLEENLQGHGLELASMPHVLQFNKRDLPNALGVDTLNEALNAYNVPFYEAVATQGIGVQETLRHITKLVLVHLNERYGDRRRKGAAAASGDEESGSAEPAEASSPPQATPVSTGPPPAGTAAPDPGPEMAASHTDQPSDQGPQGPVEDEPAAVDLDQELAAQLPGGEPEPAEEEPPLAMPSAVADDLPSEEEPLAGVPAADSGESAAPEPAEEEPPLAMPSAVADEPPAEEEPLGMPGPVSEPAAAAPPDPSEGAAPMSEPLGDPSTVGIASEPAPEPRWHTSEPAFERGAEVAAFADEETAVDEPTPPLEPHVPSSPSPAPLGSADLEGDDILGVTESLSEASVAVAVEEEPAEQDVFRVAPAVPPSVGIGSTQQIDREELDQALGGHAAPSAGLSTDAQATEVDASDPLFGEPGVEPTRLAPGAPQEILVPLELEVSGEIRRFRLVLKLQLDH